jgi:DNA-binding YbaB/EbfC family protein
MKMKQIQKMMKQAQSMQSRMEEEMSQLSVEATSGGGAVAVVMDGKKNLKSISISEDAVDLEDLEMLEDLILTAVNEASRKVEESLNSQLSGLGNGLFGGL